MITVAVPQAFAASIIKVISKASASFTCLFLTKQYMLSAKEQRTIINAGITVNGVTTATLLTTPLMERPIYLISHLPKQVGAFHGAGHKDDWLDVV